MDKEENYEVDAQELLLHSVLPQSRIIEKYRKKYGLDEELPCDGVLQMMEEADTHDLLPMDLLLDTCDNDDSAEDYLLSIEEGDEDALGMLMTASVARRYVGFCGLSILSYEELIDAGQRGLIKGINEYEEKDGDHYLAFVIWHIHHAIYEEFLMAANREKLLEETRTRRRKIARENYARFHLEKDQPTQEALTLLDDIYKDEMDLTALMHLYEDGNPISRAWEIVAHEPYLSCKEEDQYILEARNDRKETEDEIPGSLGRLLFRIAKEYDEYSRVELLFHDVMITLLLEGAEGLVEAVRSYDQDANCSIRSLAAWWIHYNMVHWIIKPRPISFFLTDENWPEEEVFKIESEYEILQEDHEPAYEELMEIVGPEIEIVRHHLKPEPKLTLDQELQIFYEGMLHLNADAPSEEALQTLQEMLEAKPRNLDVLKQSYANRELAEYLDRIAQIPPLSQAEERDLFDRYKKGVQKAKKEIIRANLKLCVSIVQEYFRYARSINPELLMYLILDGNEGLGQAVEAYDEKEGRDFQAFAAWYIHRRVNEGFALEVRDTNTMEEMYLYICG